MLTTVPGVASSAETCTIRHEAMRYKNIIIAVCDSGGNKVQQYNEDTTHRGRMSKSTKITDDPRNIIH